MKKKNKQKGILFTTDALLAGVLLIGGLALLNLLLIHSPPTRNITIITEDILNTLSSIKMGDINDPAIQYQFELGNLTDENKSALVQIGEYWALNNPQNATYLAELLTKEVVPPGYGLNFSVQETNVSTPKTEIIYSRPPENEKTIDTLLFNRRMVTGIKESEYLTGNSATALLSRITNRTERFYKYFGGFIGQGNITIRITDIPKKATIIGGILEVDALSDFNMTINDIDCNKTFNVTNITYHSDLFNISNCTFLLNTSIENNLSIHFLEGINNSFVGGGYLRFDYFIDTLAKNLSTGRDKIWFDGIRGFINLYDGLYVPGDIQSMGIYLHYRADLIEINNTLFLSIGGGNLTLDQFKAIDYTMYEYEQEEDPEFKGILWVDNITTDETSFYLNDSFIQKHLNYTDISNKTSPLRFGFVNLDFELYTSNVDAVLITDRTRSMQQCDVPANCSHPTLSICKEDPPGTCYAQRDNVAQLADNAFVDVFLNFSKNELSLVGTGKRAEPVCDWVDFTSNNLTLKERIHSYAINTGGWCGYTCISCGVRASKDLLVEKKDLYKTNRKKFTDSDNVEFKGGTIKTDKEINLDINTSRVVKARLTLLTNVTPENPIYFQVENETGVNVSEGYHDCVYLNGKELGYLCDSNEVGFASAHMCEYPINPAWIENTTNNITITAGTQDGCIDLINSDHDWWILDETEFTIWEEPKEPANTTYEIDTRELQIKNQRLYPIISDHDLLPPADFDTPFVIPANTFGHLQTNDSWDWNKDEYGLSSSTCIRFNTDPNNDNNPADSRVGLLGPLDYNNKNLNIVTGEWKNLLNGLFAQDCTDSTGNVTGAFGVEFNIDDEMYNIIKSNGTATINLNITMGDDGTNPKGPFWVKGSITNTTGDEHFLGKNMSKLYEEDNTLDIIYLREDWFEDGILSIAQETYWQEISHIITGPGTYYLKLGVILKSWGTEKYLITQFDDIEITLANNSHTFTLNPLYNPERAKSSMLTLDITDDLDPSYYNCIFVNDIYIGRIDYQHFFKDSATSWRETAFEVPLYSLNTDNNIVRVVSGSQINQAPRYAYLDSSQSGCLRVNSNKDINPYTIRNANLSIIHGTKTEEYPKDQTMVVMSDGEANVKIGDGRNNRPVVQSWLETIDESCNAKQQFDIGIYAVSFGEPTEGGLRTLNRSACCDSCDNFFFSDNTDELLEIYNEIANSIINSSIQSQLVRFLGSAFTSSDLFSDSYIEINYTPSIRNPEFGEVSVDLSIENITTCNEHINIPSQIRIGELFGLTYSGDLWNSLLHVNNSIDHTTIYNLTTFAENFTFQGDPFAVGTQGNIFNPDLIGNEFTYQTIISDKPQYEVDKCSKNNSIVYSGYVQLGAEFSDILPKAEGCNWTVEYDQEHCLNFCSYPFYNITVPSDYYGSKHCRYTFVNVSYDLEDAYDHATYKLLRKIDFDTDNRTYFHLGDSDLEIISTLVDQIPYLWGPLLLQVSVWQ